VQCGAVPRDSRLAPHCPEAEGEVAEHGAQEARPVEGKLSSRGQTHTKHDGDEGQHRHGTGVASPRISLQQQQPAAAGVTAFVAGRQAGKTGHYRTSLEAIRIYHAVLARDMQALVAHQECCSASCLGPRCCAESPRRHCCNAHEHESHLPQA